MTEPLTHIRRALADLRHARDLLRLAEADKAADAVNRAIKSAEGAERHAQGKADRARRLDPPCRYCSGYLLGTGALRKCETCERWQQVPLLAGLVAPPAEPTGCRHCDENPEGDYTGTDATRWRCRACDNWNPKDSRWLAASDRY